LGVEGGLQEDSGGHEGAAKAAGNAEAAQHGPLTRDGGHQSGLHEGNVN
jgi:hypothetical protein